MGSTFRKGSESSGQSSALSNTQAAMAQQLFDESTPLRQAGNWYLNNFLVNQQTPEILKSTVGIGVPLAQQAQELGAARNQILNTTARGGLQQRMLMELPIQRMLNNDLLQAQARGIDDATRQNLFSTATNIGQGSPVSAMTGLAGAAGNLNSLGQQRIGQNQLFQSGMGQLGGAIGKGLMMCWLAERFYGRHSPRTFLLRQWFRAQPDWWATKLYVRYGAWLNRQWFCPILRPVFALCLRRATTWAHSAAA
jgi:hypothetical protein